MGCQWACPLPRGLPGSAAMQTALGSEELPRAHGQLCVHEALLCASQCQHLEARTAAAAKCRKAHVKVALKKKKYQYMSL